MEGHNTTFVSNTAYSTNDSGYDYPQHPASTTYYNAISGQPTHYQPKPATPRYYPAQSNHKSKNTVVVTQPAPHTTHVEPDNMGLAVFACLCCCWPLGLVAIFRANDSRVAFARGDVEFGRRIAADSRRFSLIAIGVGIVILLSIILAITVPIVVATSRSASAKSYSSSTYYNG